MNSIVALPIAAAVPVASPSIAAAGATQADDPIFAAIEAHRRAFRRRTRYSLSTATLRKRCQKASHKAAFPSGKIAGISPVTTAGAAAILAYSVEQPCKIGCKYPQFDDDDGVTRPFEFFVIQNCAAALAKLAAAA